jgi:riboflavin kinase / FMN adenylyltransferase
VSAFVFAADPNHPPSGLENAVYAIGNFDGVHLGHQAVIARTRALAKARGAPAAILTFEPHPADYFAERSVVFRLTSPRVKSGVFEQLGLNGAVVLTFNAALASLTADDFVAKVLIRRLGVSAVVVGWDFHFGKNRSGDQALLVKAGARYGFVVEIVPKVEEEEGESLRVVSSTFIRRALEQGDVDAAARWLGRPYTVTGTVSKGQSLGRTLGVPTANLALEPTNRLAYGVYAVWVTIDGKGLAGVASFGVRPTVDNGLPLLEVHVLDFAGDLYDQEIEVEFVGRIREERKFDSLDSLVAEMERDKRRAREILAQIKRGGFGEFHQIL